MKKIIFIGFILLSLSSCISTTSLSIAGGNKTGEIQLYYSDKPTLHYQEIALVSVYYDGGKNDKLLDAFKAEVKKQNGDAAINVSLVKTQNGITLSGIAIKFTK